MEYFAAMPVDFEKVKRLGEGNFGEVWLANEIGLGIQCALKCIPKAKIFNQENFFHEAQIIKQVEHENIIKVFDTGMLDDDTIYISMEYARRGSLDDESEGAHLPISRAKRIFIDVLRGVEFIHSHGVIHRDIKPANILIGERKEAKLSDFGLAIPINAGLDPAKLKTNYKYIIHLAPEVENFSDFSTFSDIYACGVTFYRLLNGDVFLPAPNPLKIIDDIRRGKFPNRKLYREFIPKQLRTVLNKAMDVDPARRFSSAEEFRHAIEKVMTVANWHEKRVLNGTQWVNSQGKDCFVVRRTKKGGRYFVETKKGTNISDGRKIGKHSGVFTDEKSAISFTKEVLQGFVTGKYK